MSWPRDFFPGAGDGGDYEEPDFNGGGGFEPGDEPDDDPLADLDPETARIVSERAAQLANAEKSRYGRQIHQSLQNAGIDLTNGGRVAVVDPQKAQSVFGGFFQAPAAAAAQQQQQAAPEEPEEMPDPTMDPEGFREWQRKEFTNIVKSTMGDVLKPMQQQTQAVVGTIQQQMAGNALNIVTPLMDQAGLGHIADHEAFPEMFNQALVQLGVPMDKWSDPATLLRAATFVLPEMMQFAGSVQQQQPRQGRQPQAPRQQQQQQPRQATPQQQARSYANRMGIPGFRPSNGARGGGMPEFSEIDQEYARLRGISVEDAAALGSDSYDSWRQHQQRKQARQQARGGNGGNGGGGGRRGGQR